MLADQAEFENPRTRLRTSGQVDLSQKGIHQLEQRSVIGSRSRSTYHSSYQAVRELSHRPGKVAKSDETIRPLFSSPIIPSECPSNNFRFNKSVPHRQRVKEYNSHAPTPLGYASLLDSPPERGRRGPESGRGTPNTILVMYIATNRTSFCRNIATSTNGCIFVLIRAWNTTNSIPRPQILTPRAPQTTCHRYKRTTSPSWFHSSLRYRPRQCR